MELNLSELPSLHPQRQQLQWHCGGGFCCCVTGKAAGVLTLTSDAYSLDPTARTASLLAAAIVARCR